jgi:ankyrin repeat protein
VEHVRLLLGAGPGTRTQGLTPLENAIYSDATQVVDLLAEHGIIPQALWTYAACGRLDLVRACFDADGRLRPDAASSRPNSADIFVGFPPHPGDRRSGADHAVRSSRGIRLLLERGADPSIRDEIIQADADGWLHLLYATRWHDPVPQQIHDLIESRSRQA